ncbi:MAG: 3-deoxy-D-manno-octulosonic acid transferase [Bacteroidales bacterium]|nr:3-deoxy-D-manno-octulosonic acid transferase [Bacteroidales bacterium]
MLMLLLYTVGIFFYRCGIAIASLFNPKAKNWEKGRRKIFEQLEQTFDGSQHPVWVHCASLGEYEQGKPLIEKIKREHPETKVLVTFFSPSGYEASQNDPLPDYIFYLPIDLRKKAKRFISIVQPQLAVFVKYEFWFNYIYELNKQQIPFYYICAIFRSNQYFFKMVGQWFGKQLHKASYFFVQNEESKQLLANIGITQAEVCGDTRFDRVYEIACQSASVPEVEQFQQQSKLLVAGSTWQPDEQLLAELLPQLPDFKLIVAPHEIKRSEEVAKTFASFPTALITSATPGQLADSQVLIVNTIGLLKKVYRYGTFAYVGGAFKTGLHNILEAAVYDTPVFFGPHYQHFNEAVMLTQQQGAFSVNNSAQLLQKIQHLIDHPEEYQKTCNICHQYIQANLGSCDRIYSIIQKNIV